MLACGATIALAACTQGEDIASPGATNPGTPPAAGGGGGTGGGTGGGGATASCPASFPQIDTIAGATETLVVCGISGILTGTNTLSATPGVVYQLDGRVDVGVDRGANGTGGTEGVLNIPAGVTVFGDGGSDYIVVNRGSRIEATGSATAPIIFTSRADIDRQLDADTTNNDPDNAIGEWGGMVLLGRAPINRCLVGNPGDVNCNNVIEGVTNPDAAYGGDFATDNSGTLRYVQVRFAGNEVSLGNELNGITFGGVGSDTTLEYIQVHNNSDDGVEFFGGTADIKYLVLTGNDDESLDTDNGWNGRVQFMVVEQRAGGGDNGFEMSSAGVGVANPTNPTVANFTLIGSRTRGIRINSGHVGRFINGIVNYTGAECFDYETAGNDDAVFDGIGIDPSFNSVVFDCPAGFSVGNPNDAALTAAIAADANNDSAFTNSLAATFFPGPNENGVTAFDLTTLGGTPFFTDVSYIGAFGPDETETNNWATGWTFSLFPDPTCPADTVDTGTTINGLNVCAVEGVLTSDLRLTRGNIYEIAGRIDVGEDQGADPLAPLAGTSSAVLTIEPGVTLFGNSGSDYVVVNRGSQIFSNGTRANPVIFTSQADLLDPARNDEDINAEWGGMVLLGRAPINRCLVGSPGDLGCNNVIEGVTNPEAAYGGATINSGDSSGSITFTQVKFAGNEISLGNELNGITFGGVGSGTNLEYIQVHNNSDDGVEFFGGTADIKHLVLTGNDDESLDTDNGWDGAVQFMIVQQRANGGDNGFEMSSAGVGIANPTNPQISNFTLVGARTRGIRINSGHVGRFMNGVVFYTGAECLDYETAGNDDATFDGIGTDPSFQSVVFDCAAGFSVANPNNAALDAAIAADANNDIAFTNSLVNGFVNGTNEDGVTAFDPTGVDPFFEAVDYVGAVEDLSDRWWADWSCGLEAATPC